MTYFTSKTILITGATSGIGEALALNLAKQNCHLIISGRNKERLKSLEKEINDSGSKCFMCELDLSNPQSIEAFVEKIKTQFNSIDILINNGGISQRSLAENTNEQVLRNILETNFFGTVKLTIALLPLMKNKGGNIAVTSSLAGKVGTRLRSSYSASKHALHGYFDSLRCELIDYNIKVTLVCPGYIHTNISINALTEKGEKHGKMDKGQEKGMSAEKCAQKYLKSVSKGKNEVYIGGIELIVIFLKRFMPFLFYRLITRIKE